jgi:4-azaleucine resistance transporter AzlC
VEIRQRRWYNIGILKKERHAMARKQPLARSLRAAFPYTIPILTGFIFLGIAFGYYMNTAGFGAVYPIVISATVFAGSMEFVTVSLLLSAFDPVRVLILTLMINARHLFYGLSMLDKYRAVGRKQYALIYGMCDETFSINCTVDIPPDVDKGWFMLFVTILNYLYWLFGTAVGAVLGSLVVINTEGLSFVLTALFVVIFLEQWLKEKAHHSALLGLLATLLCLLLFGKENFILPAMLIILACLTAFKKPLEKAGERI